jgi:hypothetical protein
MKKRLIFVVALMGLATLPFYAQKLHAGITAGLNVATLSEPGDLYNNSALKTGFGGGLSLVYDLTSAWGIQSGLMYEQKGFRRKNDFGSGEEKLTGTYNYLTLPVLVQGSLVMPGNTRLYGITGAYAGFKTYSENALVATGNETTAVPDGDNIEKLDYGWIIGGGIQVPAGNHFVQAGLKYSLGLTRVTDTNPDDRNKSLLVSVTFFL